MSKLQTGEKKLSIRNNFSATVSTVDTFQCRNEGKFICIFMSFQVSYFSSAPAIQLLD